MVQEWTGRMTRLPTQDEIPNTTDDLDQAEHFLVRFGMRHDRWSGNNHFATKPGLVSKYQET